jgi:hypothetical protein
MSIHLLGSLVLALLSPAVPGVLAQMNMAGHVMEMQEQISPEKLPPPVRMPGIGNAHMEITATPEAQMWFDGSDRGRQHEINGCGR